MKTADPRTQTVTTNEDHTERIEVCRSHGISVGQLDARQWYTARIKLAGEKAKNSGEEVFADMRYFPRPYMALRDFLDRIPAAPDVARYVARVEDAARAVIKASAGLERAR